MYGGTSYYAGRPPEEFDPTVIDFDNTPGCGGPEQRLREQDQDGIDAEVLFALEVRSPAIRDRDVYVGIIHHFNEFMAEEYCSVDPERLIGVGVLPNRGVEDDIAEMEHCKRLGVKAVWLATYPSGRGFPSPEDDRFWAAALDLDVPVVVHTSFTTKVGTRETPLFQYPREPSGERRPPTDFVQRLARQGPYHSGSVEASQMVVAGIFDRFPKLRIYWAENNVGWLPYFYEQMDHEYSINRFWAERQMGLPRLKRLPSEYLREHAFWGFLRGPRGRAAAPRRGRGPHAMGQRLPSCGDPLAPLPGALGLADERRRPGGAAPDGGRQRRRVLPPRIAFDDRTVIPHPSSSSRT